LRKLYGWKENENGFISKETATSQSSFL
jgi:hypothetical protein